MSVAYELWFFPDTSEFGEAVAGTDLVVPLSPATVILKAAYVGEGAPPTTTLDQARQRLATRDFHGRDDIHLLRPVISPDGVPFRAALIYAAAGRSEVGRFGDPRIPQAHRVGVYRTLALRYQAVRVGSPYTWERKFALGEQCFFLTGVGGASELWRVARLETDALDRQVLTLAPVRLAHGIAMPDFGAIADPRLREYLSEQFQAFQRAVASAAHFEVVDRAANIAEGVLAHCLVQVGQEVPRSLGERLEAARRVREDRELRPKFLLSDLAFHLAQKIRILHARTHEDQAVTAGRAVLPETAIGVARDLSDLLVEVGLARN